MKTTGDFARYLGPDARIVVANQLAIASECLAQAAHELADPDREGGPLGDLLGHAFLGSAAYIAAMQRVEQELAGHPDWPALQRVAHAQMLERLQSAWQTAGADGSPAAVRAALEAVLLATGPHSGK